MQHPFQGILSGEFDEATDVTGDHASGAAQDKPRTALVSRAYSRRGLLRYAATIFGGAALIPELVTAQGPESGRNRGRHQGHSADEWWDRLAGYYSGRNYWGPGYRRGRGRYTTQALYEEGGRGRYTTYALGEEGGRGYRGGYRRPHRWDNRHHGRDRDRRRYTTYALGEEG